MIVAKVLERARACVGAKFRLHGRDPATGLDCVGLAAFAYEVEAPSGYAIRGGEAGRIAELIAAARLVRVAEPGAGDLLLCASGPGQWHFAVATGDGVIHACAVLRRVVERAGPPPWPVMARWRRQAEGE